MDNLNESINPTSKPLTNKSVKSVFWNIYWYVLIFTIVIIVFVPLFNRFRDPYRPPARIVCAVNLHNLGTAIEYYALDHKDLIPPADQWCDLLITETAIDPKFLYCPDSDAIEGESSYAININAVGREIRGLPPDMVLLFETDIGKEEGLRTGLVSKRAYYPFMKKFNPERFVSYKDQMVYPKRWNQSGEIEMLSTTHTIDDQPGCNIVFVDGKTELVPASKISSLRWTADKSPAKTGEMADLPASLPK